MLNKYPKLQSVVSYDFSKTYTLSLISEKIEVEFVLFDAKHIPGAAMILLKRFVGTILFTGDFGYEYSMVKDNP